VSAKSLARRTTRPNVRKLADAHILPEWKDWSLADMSDDLTPRRASKGDHGPARTATFDERIASEAQRLEVQAKTMAPGRDRDMLLRKARQTKTAAHINEWLSSPGLMSPK
jgi:hypothetical protein